jgi:hypothetical protein
MEATLIILLTVLFVAIAFCLNERENHKRLRLAVRVRGIILQGGSSYPMIAGKSERFQLVATDQFGNVIGGAAFASPSVTGDPKLGTITLNTSDASLFDLASPGPAGTDPLSLSAVVTAPGGSPITLSGTLSVVITPDVPTKLSANDLGLTPAAS